MDAKPKNLEDMLLARRQHVIPEYQRPYVWTPEEHVLPFLQDIETLCERSLRGVDVREHPHFAGAVVLQKVPRDGYDAMDTWAVVDGQQRMTTVQLIMRAVGNVAQEHGLDAAPHIRFVMNEGTSFEAADDRWKLWPTWNIREDWRKHIDPEAHGVDVSADASLQMGENLTFAQEHIAAWARTASEVAGLTADVDEGERIERKLRVYHTVMKHGLQFVVVDLGADENAQIIFETLNGTGARLLAADLVKNHVFRSAELNGESLEELARDIWAPLDTKHWRDEIGRGHRRRPRIEYFLQHWLMAETAEETPNQEVFNAFQARFDDLHESTSVLDDAREFRAAADAYDALDHPVTAAQKRINDLVGLLSLQTVRPVLLRLELDVRAGQWNREQHDEALEVIESWIARRMLLRLNTRAYGTTFVEMVAALRAAPDNPADALRELLGRKTSDANRWPLDSEIITQLPRLPLYGSVSQQRIVYALRELELGLRTAKGEGIDIPAKLTVEHVIPQSWAANWPLADSSDEARARRTSVLHTVGNLTLVVQRLNAGLSNAAWISKRDEINKHSELMLNRRLFDEHPELFSDEDALARGAWLAERACARWKRIGPEPNQKELDVAIAHTVRDEDGAVDANAIDEDDLESVLSNLDGTRYTLARDVIAAYRDGRLEPARLRRKQSNRGYPSLRVHVDGRGAAAARIVVQKGGIRLVCGPEFRAAIGSTIPADRMDGNEDGWTRVLFNHEEDGDSLVASVAAIAHAAADS